MEGQVLQQSFSSAGKQHCNIPLQIMLHTTTILTKVNEGILVITVLLTYIQVLLGCDAISLHHHNAFGFRVRRLWMTVKNKALQSFRVPEPTHPTTQHRTPHDLNLHPRQSLEICTGYSVSQPQVLPTFCPSTVKVSTECNFVLKHMSCLFSIFNQNSGYLNVWI